MLTYFVAANLLAFSKAAAAAAAAKLLQSCLTLCDPMDGSPSGSPVPGILQARTLEWIAISFSILRLDQPIYKVVYSTTTVFLGLGYLLDYLNQCVENHCEEERKFS